MSKRWWEPSDGEVVAISPKPPEGYLMRMLRDGTASAESPEEVTFEQALRERDAWRWAYTEARAPRMTVGQLREALADLPDEMPVQIELDSEEGTAQWLRCVCVAPGVCPGSGEEEQQVILSWDPPSPDEEKAGDVE
jgi:hypothetical protein